MGYVNSAAHHLRFFFLKSPVRCPETYLRGYHLSKEALPQSLKPGLGLLVRLQTQLGHRDAGITLPPAVATFFIELLDMSNT